MSTRRLPHVLVVDDERVIRMGLTGALEDVGHRVSAAEGLAAARVVLAGGDVDAVLLDVRLKDGDGLAFLDEVRAGWPALPVIMATAYGDSDRTIAAMARGAFDYITKPFDLDVLITTLGRAVHRPERAAAQTASTARFVGSSPPMLAVWKAIGRAAKSDAPVLITGETGVGKDLVAQAIHGHGARSASPFVAVNIAALPSTLIESELFGHERGAFTGATTRREGRFETAADGTLFLDEIGDLDAALQTKLLRVLEDGGFERVGGTQRLVSRARIISATSRPVHPNEPGSFLRDDLYYRLGVVRIDVPPLRHRRQDIPLLVDAFIRQQQPPRAISADALALLVAREWPGNVRELLHLLEQAAVMSAAEVLDVGDFGGLAAAAAAAPVPGSSGPIDDDDLDLKKHLDDLERRLITRALAKANNNRAEAARLLHIRRPQLYARLKDLGL